MSGIGNNDSNKKVGNNLSGNVLPSAKIGDLDNGDYTEFENDGTMVAKGDATTWDDIYVSPSELNPLGAVSYVSKQFQNDGITGSGSAIALDGVDQYGQVTDYANLDVSGDWTLEFWARPNSNPAGQVISREDYWDLEIRNNQRLSFDGPAGNRVQTPNGSVLLGVWQHFVVVGTDLGSSTLIEMYIDAVLQESATRAFVLGANASDLFVGTEFGLADYFDGDLDEMIFYNVPLTQSQVDERFNNGSGTINPATGITAATDYVAYFKFDDGSGATADNGATLGAGEDMTLNNSIQWIDGVIGQSENLGVFLPAFEPGKIQAASFDMPIPHAWENKTSFHPHVHISTKEIIPAGSKIVLFFEYTWISPNGVFSTTTTDEKIFTFADEIPAYTHTIVEFTVIDTTSVTTTAVSPHMACSFSRKGFEANDTLNIDVFLLNFGIHFISNMMGSRDEYVK